jgi:branched-chain amino acid aminotransferase
MSDLIKGAAWMDGQIMPIAEAKIGVTDWGLTRSDITYDVVQVWDGAFFRLDDHLDRFAASMQRMRLAVPQDRADMQQILHDLVRATGLRRAYCAFVASRGLQSVPGSRDPRTCVNYFYAWVVPYVHVIPEAVTARGTALKIAEGVERISHRSVDPTAKNYHWGDITDALFQAIDQGFDTVALPDADGNISEGPGFNIFAVRDGVVMTPLTGVLEGITRKSVIEICESLGLPIRICTIPVAAFLEADEVFLTSSSGGVMPVTRINQRILGNGVPGPITDRLRQSYEVLRATGPRRITISYVDD